MDIDRLEQIARTVKTREELEQLKSNALKRGEMEGAKLVNEILLERFPVRSKASSGATPTEARVHARVELFDSGKEAYLWLVEQFRLVQPLALERYLNLQARGKSRAKGSRFAKTKKNHSHQTLHGPTSLRTTLRLQADGSPT